jgi:hypothetical protein
MTPGETLFYLREIHPHWTTSNVSATKLAELHAARLIEINTALPTVRLTSEGARCKNLGRKHGAQTTEVRSLRMVRAFRPRSAKKNVTRARPLV